MGGRDPRIDAYIAAAAPFARPILEHVREAVHAACPQVEETMKWSSPSFVHAGGILAGMAAFKRHASFGFWKHALVMGADAGGEGMGSYGELASLRDLPPKRRLIADIERAMAINETGAKATRVRKASAPKPPPEAPPDLLAALARSPSAQAAFDGFPPSARRDYIEWIVEATGRDTRARRVAQAAQWLAEGKRRHWKYERC